MNRLLIFIILLISGLHFKSFAQNKFNIHLDKSNYIAGEYLNYQIYPNKNIREDSMIIYAELYSPTGNMDMQYLHKLNAASVGGSFYLPYSLKEGNYVFVAYAVYDAIKSDTSAHLSSFVHIPIFNDLEETADGEQAEEWLSYQSNTNAEKDKILQNFKRKSKIEMELDLGENLPNAISGTYSVSIQKKFKEISEPILHDDGNLEYEISSANWKCRKQLILDGRVIDPISFKPVSESYLSLYLPSLGLFERIKAVKGRIKSILPDLNGKRNFQLLSMNPNQRYPLQWIPVKNYFDRTNITEKPSPLTRSGFIHYLLQQQSKKRIVDDLFENKILLPEPRMDTVKKYSSDKLYKMTDFLDIASLEEFIEEVMLGSKITSIINGKKSLRLRNRDQFDLYRWPAWYLVDGYFRGDEANMLNFDISRIKSIEIFDHHESIQSQFDPLMVYNGIFSINTHLQDQPALHSYQINTWYHSDINHNLFKPDMNKPDLRTALAWFDQISTNDAGKLKLEFYSSDIRGLFTIDIKGINKTGDFISTAYTIEIE